MSRCKSGETGSAEPVGRVNITPIHLEVYIMSDRRIEISADKIEGTDVVTSYETKATYLIADILHYLASQNVEPETALKTALMHFEAER